MIAVQNLELRAGARLLMEDVTFRIDKGDKIGLVGRNGAGKTRSRDGEAATGDILRVKALGKFHECHAP